ncbi:MAG: D-TA family PLP-dependent enzyme [Saprospiraceae bacterium]
MNWYEINGADQILSPALAIYPDRIKQNIEQMISIAGSKRRLRPHVKTYKMPQIVKMQMDMGITKFKCSTIAEAKMLVDSGCNDIVLAMPTVGPAQFMTLKLKREHSKIKLGALIDNKSQIKSWKNHLEKNESVDLFIDINVGMNRTGIDIESAKELYSDLLFDKQFNIRGLHVYDGHNRRSTVTDRAKQVEEEYDPVQKWLQVIDPNDNLEVICGGSITFPCHARDGRRTLSPGTTLLWDAGYGTHFPDIPMKPAAILITRVISLPDNNLICLDLGHKSIGSEMQDKRVIFPQLADYKRVGHSEEHLVLQLKDTSTFMIGDVIYGIPWHICPTVALHAEVVVIEKNEVIDYWPVVARHRHYRLS